MIIEATAVTKTAKNPASYKPAPAEIPSEFFTAKEVCIFLRIGRTSLWHLEKQGKLQPIRLNSRIVRYRKSEILSLGN